MTRFRRKSAVPDPVRIIPGWHGAEYASLVEEEKSLFDKLMDCKDADEALSIMQQLVDIERARRTPCSRWSLRTTKRSA